jgi:hypothetical protein
MAECPPGLPYTVHTGADSSGEIERISAHDITPDEFAQKYIKRCPRACACARAHIGGSECALRDFVCGGVQGDACGCDGRDGRLAGFPGGRAQVVHRLVCADVRPRHACDGH